MLELKCVEEESNREIARRLGLKESPTVATRVLRGRTMLAAALEKEGTSMDERMLRHALMEANLERFRDVGRGGGTGLVPPFEKPDAAAGGSFGWAQSGWPGRCGSRQRTDGLRAISMPR